ncbi:MAG: peptide-methionine (R)-S-oxide reductase MsrB [Armatimonadetes bacterium]|nr:peptide-methionine (R)-S-oxide reductase MsrB [Armatimonadota bacterium]
MIGNFTVLDSSPKREDKVVKTEDEWKKLLTPAQFKILRSHGTEPAFCGIFHDNHKDGIYNCAGCKLPLFKSDAKFDSGTGWPSFFQPVEEKNVWLRKDTSYGMIRYEALCARCDGHLGHVFDDGPKPTGLRFCINSDGLVFEEKKK